MTGTHDESDDDALLRAHVAGDRDAFTVLVRRHRDRLWAVALRTLSDPDEAEDALQDALISAFRNADGFRGDAAVTTWLHRVVVNACLDRMRRRQARPSVPLADRDIGLGTARGDALGEVDHPTRTVCPGRPGPTPDSNGSRWYCSTCRATRWRRSPRCSTSRRAPSRAGAPAVVALAVLLGHLAATIIPVRR